MSGHEQALLNYLREKFEEATPEEERDYIAFLDFAQEYLEGTKSLEQFPIFDNIGVRLTDGARITIYAPVEGRPGDMANTGAVPITDGSRK